MLFANSDGYWRLCQVLPDAGGGECRVTAAAGAAACVGEQKAGERYVLVSITARQFSLLDRSPGSMYYVTGSYAMKTLKEWSNNVYSSECKTRRNACITVSFEWDPDNRYMLQESMYICQYI